MYNLRLMKFFKLKKFLYLIPVFLLVLFIGFKSRQASQQKDLKINLKKVQTVEVTRGDLEKNLVLAGKIAAQDYAILRFQGSGELAWLGVKEGDRVKKWQAVASLKKESLKKSLQKEANDYLTSRWNFEDLQDQYRQTRDSYLITDEMQRILDRQQFSLNNAVLDYELADLAVKYASLVSPIEGIVTNLDYPSSGINITPTNFSITVVNPNSLYFRSEVDEQDVVNLKPDQPAKISLDSFEDESFDSKITQIAFTPVEGQTATVYELKFLLDQQNPDLKYKIGMNGDVTINLLKVNDVLYLPIEAIFEENGQSFVYLKSKTAIPEKREIQTGLENDSYVEITSGLAENDLVVYSE